VISGAFFRELAFEKLGKRIIEDDRPVQTSLKYPLLCKTCENHFGKFEKSFIEEIYRPLIADRDSGIVSDYHLLFLDSICWRIIQTVITGYALGQRHGMVEKNLRLVIRHSKDLRSSLAAGVPSKACLRFICPDFRVPNLGYNADSLFRMSIISDCFFNGHVFYCFSVLPGGILVISIYSLSDEIRSLWRDAQALAPSNQINAIAYRINDGTFAAYMLYIAEQEYDRPLTDENAFRILKEVDMEALLRSPKFAAIVRDLTVSAPENARALIIARGELELADFGKSTINLNSP